MKILAAVSAIVFFCLCSPTRTDNETSHHTFALKFINTGTYTITGFYFKPLSDTGDWGQSLLPVASLATNDYFFAGSFTKGEDYAFRTRYDSAGAGIDAYLVFEPMATNGPDTISAYASIGPGGYSNGYNWGLGTWQDEHLVGALNPLMPAFR
jgi:hypothetical protein